MARGRDRLREGLQTIRDRFADAPFETASTVDALFENLPSQLMRMLAPTLVLELNVARLQGELTGDTPEERFDSFLRLMRGSNAAVAILKNYPTLAHQLVIHINNWVDFSLQFVNHLCSDWDAIRLTFGAARGTGPFCPRCTAASGTRTRGEGSIDSRDLKGAGSWSTAEVHGR